MLAGAESIIMYVDIASLVEETAYFERVGGDVIPEPNSCAVCGCHGPKTGLYSSKRLGYHHWIEPSNEVRLKRMKARRLLKALKSV